MQRDSFFYLSEMKILNWNIVDQWGLIHCALAAIRHTMKHPEIRMYPFTVVNIHLKHQIPFQKWYKKIDSFMQASNSFNHFSKNEHLDKYKILPLFWQEMDLDTKKTAVYIVKTQGIVWNIDCLSQFKATCKLTNADVVSLQP